MLTAVILLAIGAGVVYFVHKQNKESFARPIKKVETTVKNTVDVNDDGKVDVKDAVAVAKKAGKAVKITAEKVKKTAGRKKKNP